MPEPIRILLLGAGNRGATAYGAYALQHPDEVQFTAVAEPNPVRRRKFSADHCIPEERQFTGWREALKAGKLADAAINATQDALHHDSTLAALAAGYDILLEKPIAPTLEETTNIIRAAEASGRTLQICHVLRFTDFFQTMHEILHSGSLGQIITLSHRENVSYFHMAHSFVRGNWRNTAESAPMILAKCCHDLDLLYWFLGEKALWLSSTGGLRHFRAENAPAGAPMRCTNGCPAADACPYYAPRIYRDILPIKQAVRNTRNRLYQAVGALTIEAPRLAATLGQLIPPIRTLTEYSGWPRNTITDAPEQDAAVMDALHNGPYGRCVYLCDNDVVDHQVVSLTFESGISATLTMHGHSHEEGRTLRVDGSRGTLLGKFSFSRTWIEVHTHGGGVTRLDFPAGVESTSGHGGGDSGLMRQFLTSLRGEEAPLTTARDSVESHLMAFAAEEARLAHQTVDLSAFRARAGLPKPTETRPRNPK